MERFAYHVYDNVAKIELKFPLSPGGKLLIGAASIGVSIVAAGVIWRYYIRDAFYARLLNKIAPEFEKRMETRKRTLFSGLEELRKAKGENLVIVDVGCGNGVNFRYYPECSEVICVDLNPCVEPFLRAGSVTWPSGVHVGQYHARRLEEMHEFVDPEVADAVVAYGVLCFLPDLDLGLQEILRVLKPGGKLFFTDHVLSPSCYPFVRRLQLLINPLWKLIMGGCNCNRTILENIRRAGFSQVEAENFEAYELEQPTRVMLFTRIIRSHLSGMATK